MRLAVWGDGVYIRAMHKTVRDAQDSQFSLTDRGEILFRPDPTNPLPGTPVGSVVKGETSLVPRAVPGEAAAAPEDAARLQAWLETHIAAVLEPLAALNDAEPIAEAARTVALRLREALGVLPRADLAEPIAALDEEGRRTLRARKVRLGPILVFVPALNKPAAVRLRALLWTLWRDGALPAAVPPDGATSFTVPADGAGDPLYYRAVGYPLVGPRAVRVDMLDRLIAAVYERAEKGVFQAGHDMAEWLGCSIPDLYAVLEALGHVKIHDPAEDAAAGAAESAPAAPEDPPSPPEKPPEEAPEKTEAAPDSVTLPSSPAPQVKPDLATFRLRPARPKGKGAASDHKPAPRRAPKKQASAPRKERRDAVISAGPQKKPEDSPFAVLKDLKIHNRD